MAWYKQSTWPFLWENLSIRDASFLTALSVTSQQNYYQHMRVKKQRKKDFRGEGGERKTRDLTSLFFTESQFSDWDIYSKSCARSVVHKFAAFLIQLLPNLDRLGSGPEGEGEVSQLIIPDTKFQATSHSEPFLSHSCSTTHMPPNADSFSFEDGTFQITPSVLDLLSMGLYCFLASYLLPLLSC